jgi:DNA-binding transcriptional regulator YiaG
MTNDLAGPQEAVLLPHPAERRQLRRTAGVSLGQVQMVLGGTEKTVRRWECGKPDPRGTSLAAYGRLLRGWALRHPAPAGQQPQEWYSVPLGAPDHLAKFRDEIFGEVDDLVQWPPAPDELVQLRTEAGLSLEEAARWTHVNLKTIQGYEAGIAQPWRPLRNYRRILRERTQKAGPPAPPASLSPDAQDEYEAAYRDLTTRLEQAHKTLAGLDRARHEVDTLERQLRTLVQSYPSP